MPAKTKKTRPLIVKASAKSRPRAPRPRRPKKAPPALKPHGTVIAAFEVDGRAVPWSPPKVMGKVARTGARVKTWKESVATAAHASGFGEAAGVPPYEGPVAVELWFCRAVKVKRRRATRCTARPDWDNLAKGVCDALSGNVFRVWQKRKRPTDPKPMPPPPSPIGRLMADDNQVSDAMVFKRYWSRDLVYIKVVAVDPRDDGPYPFTP